MQDGFIKVASATPDIRVADIDFNVKNIIKIIDNQYQNGVKVIAFPELCITGYTCSDLFLQKILIDSALKGLFKIAKSTQNKEILAVVGLPVFCFGKLYNCAAVLFNGEILGFVPKTYLPNYSEFYEKRHFQPAPDENKLLSINGQDYLFGKNIIFRNKKMHEFSIAIEICEDLWAPQPVSILHAIAGAQIIINISASNDFIGKETYRRDLVKGQSGRLMCGYIYANAGEGESTTDLIFGGQDFICENGSILAESEIFKNGVISSEIDVSKLAYLRRLTTTFPDEITDGYDIAEFETKISETKLTRKIDSYPFVPSDISERTDRCDSILTMQALGLKKRIVHAHSETVVIGISGGLDSSLALLVCVKAMDMLGRSHKDIVAVTMPCFGTTHRTKNNAEILCERLGVTLRIIDIANAVDVHFKDIGHDTQDHSVVYENSQARERTQILMDVANQTGGFVVGTGDLSELALGFATYNGDHMSMYAVNSGVPKTLIRHIVKYYADKSVDKALKKSLYDVLDTPVSPELLPPKDGDISQVTEDIVGPYELHDFFLYCVLRWAYEPLKVYRLAKYAFNSKYDNQTILKWLKMFYRRFFAQQFKRSCLPDGPKVGSVSVSPRGDLRMPSDACSEIWLNQLENIKLGD